MGLDWPDTARGGGGGGGGAASWQAHNQPLTVSSSILSIYMYSEIRGVRIFQTNMTQKYTDQNISG